MKKLLITLAVLSLYASAQQVLNGARAFPSPNDGTTGTTVNLLAKVNTAGNAIKAGTSDTAVPTWIVVDNAGTSGSASLAFLGLAQCKMDATTASTGGFFVIASTTTGGDCHAQSSAPSGVWVVGTMFDSSTTSGSLGNVIVGPYLAATGGGSGTVSSGTSPFIAKYTASTTIGASATMKDPSSAGDLYSDLVTTDGAGATDFKPVMHNPIYRRDHMWEPSGNAGQALNSYGDLANPACPGTGAGFTSNAPTGGEAYNVSFSTANTGSGVSCAINSTNALYRFGRNLQYRTQVELGGTVTERVWLGYYASITLATLEGSADPASLNGALFRFDTSVPDTHWQCYTKDGTTANIVDSGVSADTNVHTFEILFNDTASTVTFKIDGVSKCGSPISYTGNHMPTAGTNLFATDSITTLTTGSEILKFMFTTNSSDK